jgi:hypothetical protein
VVARRFSINPGTIKNCFWIASSMIQLEFIKLFD